MIKRTLYFGSPAYLSCRNGQLVINLPNAQGLDEKTGLNTVPIEDIGIVVLDHQQITITQYLMAALLENNVALITCNSTHHPTGLMLNLDGHTLQAVRFKAQIDAKEPLKKQLWAQTVSAKIQNQAALLRRHGIAADNMLRWAREVKSGDSENMEARAAAYYWSHLFPTIPNFRRDREGVPPNALLNYGYAILRAITARSLVGSGLLPTLGIFHQNKYNAYALADDIMEPYRPWVDAIVADIVKNGEDFTELTKSLKAQMLSLPQKDVFFKKETSPLMIGMTHTTASLAACYEGKSKKINYPGLYEA
ncbi:MAG: type II CRISPR-associated endonuclease Cas1 [Cytophagaceae bacterium]|nr:type II CRISPR-associated endonuclease Cas1 [Cytophagaceae bacterium]MDW8455845.1 type II CRISPR-associated endonuclease Cas1 [Cytophagaceae bacterium]